MAVWIQGGKLVDPVGNRVEDLDLLIEGDRVVKILPPGVFSDTGPRLKRIDARNRLVVPGLVDMHVHLRNPATSTKRRLPREVSRVWPEGLRRSPVCRTPDP